MIHYTTTPASNHVWCSIKSYGQPATTDKAKVTCERCLKLIARAEARAAKEAK